MSEPKPDPIEEAAREMLRVLNYWIPHYEVDEEDLKALLPLAQRLYDAGKAPLLARIAELEKERDRLRQQNHDAAAERDRKFAPLMRELEQRRTYSRLAREMHEAEMAQKGKPIWSEISGYGEDTAAAILKQLDRLRQYVSDTVEGMECLFDCDSLGHEELCPVTNPLEAWRRLRQELAEARAARPEEKGKGE